MRSILVVLLLFAAGAFAQTTSTLCQATEVVLSETVSERRLIGCGEGFPDNLLWHLDRSDSASGALDTRVTRRFTGRGAVIYLIDSGVLAVHDEFARATGSNVTGIAPDNPNCPNEQIAPCWRPEENPTLLLVYGHGTGVASIAAGRHTGIAPDALIVSSMVSGSVAEYTRTLRQIIEHAHAPTTPSFRTAILNISGGLSVGDPNAPDLDALIRRMTTGVDAAGNDDPNGKRFLFVVAAGNYTPEFSQCGDDRSVITYPASLGKSIDGVVTVGGITRNNTFWSGSCSGNGVEIVAPAEDMFVASVSSNDAYRFKPITHVSGTSWATPYVSGMAALWMEIDPDATPARLEALLAMSRSRVDGIPVPLMPELPEITRRRRSVRH